ncbi:GNAT family N-acetyltransferase [Microbacterium murale]|uniref:GNAT superfamily N-acetyltransferase n=1 Tax=Microbacterium murale TaxID=1081040 RepID=A0ABU0PE59_9MICO|nr:GNAT family N-acetyltransferase [Microbacterium murale]MDQ0645602.1 GNAT superfamily N-acetyltransferase [Microbacterium murale]
MQTGDSTIIRRPAEKDSTVVVRIQRAEFPWALPRRPVDATRTLFRAMEQAQGNARAPFFVAESDGKVVGYACAQPYAPFVDGDDLMSPDSPVAVIPQVAVIPTARGLGIATSLLDHLHEALGPADFSIALAHIRPELRRWYERMGWTVLPEHFGVAWIEPPSVLNRRILPAEAPDNAVATHTPLMHQPPMQIHGNTTIAFRFPDASMRIIAASFYEATDDAIANGRRAAQSLIKALNDDSGARAKIPSHSAMMLQVSALEPEAAAAWIEENWPPKSPPV